MSESIACLLQGVGRRFDYMGVRTLGQLGRLLVKEYAAGVILQGLSKRYCVLERRRVYDCLE